MPQFLCVRCRNWLTMRLERLYGWWTRPCGAGEVLRVALPLVVSSISTTVMIFIDRMFLYWYSPEAMAAAMPAGMFHFTVISFPMGIALYVNTFVAQYAGAGRPRRIGPFVWQGIWVGVAAAPLLARHRILGPRSASEWANQDPVLAQYEVDVLSRAHLRLRGHDHRGRPGVVLHGDWRRTRVVMIVDTTATLLNAVTRLRLDFRAFRLRGRRRCRRRLGHDHRRVVPRARLCLADAATAHPPDLSTVDPAGGPTPGSWAG